MHAEASTPEWSDVEQGDLPDEDSDVSAEEGDDERRGDDPLWVRDLTLQDFVAWTRPNHTQTRAEKLFREEENPYAVTWGTWIILHHDTEDADEAGAIPIGDSVAMLQYDWTLVTCIDAVARPCVVAHLMGCTTGSERDLVLADSGANEVIRPAQDQPPPRSMQVDLTLADGSAIPSYRSRDGELAVPGSDSWIAPIGKIVELGYRFVWDNMTRAQLIRGEGDEAEVIYMKVENGLPYLEWHDFATLRRQLSQAYRQQKRVLCARAEIKEPEKTSGLFHLSLGLNVASSESCNALLAKHERRVKALENLYTRYARG
ncbi:unnamed protein product [Symbiodinium natans]|uniref:Uncharacterized protein n=1 Tax=Symbiodinium natans TaxID=878477 RepID=A0A812P927_9DINO|nr:unnamed protein product [Symbiodinium natans]